MTATRTPTLTRECETNVNTAQPLADVLEMVWQQVEFHALGGWTHLVNGQFVRTGCNPTGLARMARWSDARMSGGELSVVLGGRPVTFRVGAL